MKSKATKTKLVILGAGRHGRNVLDICFDLGRSVVGFLDDTKTIGTEVNGVPVLGAFDVWREVASKRESAFIVAIGWNDARRKLSSEIEAEGGELASVVHPSCQISRFAQIGSGVVISPFCRVMANATVGGYVLLEGHTTIGADAIVGEGVSSGPGVKLTGGASVGSGSFLGAGAVIVGPARVGAESMVGANSTVLTDIPDGVLATGTPASIKKKLTGPPPPP